MTSRDDMVIVPQLGEAARPTAPVKAREERALRARSRGNWLTRVGRALAARKARRVALRRASSARRFRLPVGRLLSVGVLAGAAALRLASGRSFENLGAEVNALLLGDLDDDARTRAAVRQRLSGDRDLARIIGAEGSVNSQIASIAADIERLEADRQTARRLFLEDPRFQANNTLDVLLVRARDKFLETWNGTGGPSRVEKLRGKLGGGKESPR